MIYDIAQYLTDEQKAAAVAEQYHARAMNRGKAVLFRSKDGCCPLGMALRSTHPDFEPVPTSSQVAEHLTGVALRDPDLPEFVAARRFINDWDSGNIRDLAKALGVRS